jgi:hypothetical protein
VRPGLVALSDPTIAEPDVVMVRTWVKPPGENCGVLEIKVLLGIEE